MQKQHCAPYQVQRIVNNSREMVKFKIKNFKKSLNIFDKKLQSVYIMKKKNQQQQRKEKQDLLKRGSHLFPKNIRALIVGPSGCGENSFIIFRYCS